MNKSVLYIGVLAIAVMSLGAVYKWVDEEGRVHFSDQPTDRHKTKEVDIEPSLSPEQVEEARGIAEKSQQRWRDQQEQQQPSTYRSLPLTELGPLPENESSEYIETMSTLINFNTQKLVARFSIMLKAKQRLPHGAYLEAHYPDPANLINPVIVGKVRRGAASEVLILSPELQGLKCWNYEVVVYIYRGSSKSKLLGTHSQFIQSRVNLDKVKDGMELVMAMEKGNCP
jgi:hypothetical protein